MNTDEYLEIEKFTIYEIFKLVAVPDDLEESKIDEIECKRIQKNKQQAKLKK
jgi:hypothetical protein